MSPLKSTLAVLMVVFLGACAQVYQVTPDLPDSFSGIPLNGGRTQAVTVDPNNRRNIIIATQFGGMWKTTDGGTHWSDVKSLQAVFVKDVQFAPDGRTVIATLDRDNQTVNGGGIYVSRNAGESWTRPPSGAVPSDTRTPTRGGAYSIDCDPNDPETWYVGTDYGIARSLDNGASWEHFKVDDSDFVTGAKDQDRAFAVLALRTGSVLAMINGGVYRSDDRGETWAEIRNESFSFYGPVGFNKMERERNGDAAFVLQNYSTLYYYEPGTGAWTALSLPDGGGSRAPFVRVSRGPVIRLPFIHEFELFPGWSTIWVGQGVRAVAALTVNAATTKALGADDWAVHGRGDGIHDDTGDLGVAGDLGVTLMGTDGGVFKPGSPWISSWTSGAPDGSHFNSLQITDLAGTNTTDDEGRPKTTLYFSTQDNAIWSSDNGGLTWPNFDCAEGFHIEVRDIATANTPITVAYGKIGCGPSNNMFSDAFLVNRRAVPDVDTSGNSLDKMSQAFYLAPNRWLRTRGADPDTGRNAGVYVSTNDGDNWRRRFDLSMQPLGVYHRTNVQFAPAGVNAYLPANTGQNNADGSPKIGLLRLNNLFANQTDNVGTADIVLLPDNGSLARRATEFDWQVVFGVHPRNAEFIIAPDIVNGDVKMSRDGGNTWNTNWYLTLAATQGGKYLLWDQRESRMQVTHVSYDPYDDNRILVGTRDAGVICSRDGGVTWRTLKGTGPIRYITGFHFFPGSSVIVSTYGRGLWRIKSKRARCTKGKEWVFTLPDVPGEIVPWGKYRTGRVALAEPDEGAGKRPTGKDEPRVPSLIAAGSSIGAGEIVLDDNNVLVVRGRGFDGSSKASIIAYLDRDARALVDLGQVDGDGTFLRRIELPSDLDYGEHRIEIRQESGERNGPTATIRFLKAHLDENLGEEEPGSRPDEEKAWDEQARKLYEIIKKEEKEKEQ